MAALHGFLFSWQAMYSFALGVYAALLGARNRPISGNFWGAVAIYVILNTIILLLGIALAFQGLRIRSDGRIGIYLLYMLYLIVIMPGLFSILRGRDDTRASIYFGILAMFNAAVSFSMMERGLAAWVNPT